jgi:osmotically inducible protein OsmC
MLIAQRTAEVTWDGSLASGNGRVTSGSGAFANLPVTWASRTVASAGQTSPEELIAAAHATCFTMALALVLGEAGTPPQRLSTRARCVLEEDRGAPRITRVTITVSARIDSLGAEAFQAAVDAASTLCPVSNALRENVEVTVEAKLDDNA